MTKLTDKDLDAALAEHPAWTMEGGKITRTWEFQDFSAAMGFVNEVAELAESAGHHPDIDIRYNKVTLSLVTHDAGGITAADVRMVKRLDEVYGSETKSMGI